MTACCRSTGEEETAQALEQLLSRRYGFRGPELQPLRVLPGRGIYLVKSGASRYVVRAFADAISAGELDAQARVLRFLEQRHYPACRLVPATDGSWHIREAGWSVLVTSYVDGVVAAFEPADLHELGRALGMLHELDMTGDTGLPVSSWHPASIIPRTLQWLEGIREQITDELRPSTTGSLPRCATSHCPLTCHRASCTRTSTLLMPSWAPMDSSA